MDRLCYSCLFYIKQKKYQTKIMHVKEVSLLTKYDLEFESGEKITWHCVSCGEGESGLKFDELFPFSLSDFLNLNRIKKRF